MFRPEGLCQLQSTRWPCTHSTLSCGMRRPRQSTSLSWQCALMRTLQMLVWGSRQSTMILGRQWRLLATNATCGRSRSVREGSSTKWAFSPCMLSAALQSKMWQTCTLDWQGYLYSNPSQSGALGTNQAINLIFNFTCLTSHPHFAHWISNFRLYSL